MYSSRHYICAVLYPLPEAPHSQANHAAVGQLRVTFLRVCTTSIGWGLCLWVLQLVRNTLSWPALFLFSRTPKVARRLPNCFRFSQRLLKPGDLKRNASPQGRLAKLSQGEIMDIADGEYLPLGLLTLGNRAKVTGFSQWFHTEYSGSSFFYTCGRGLLNYTICHIRNGKEVDKVSLPNSFFVIGTLRTLEYAWNQDSS